MDKKYMKYNTEVKIIQSSIKKLNKQFSLCDVLVMYHGDNRNRTSLAKQVIEENLYSAYGVPIVGEWIYKLDGTDEKTWGSHGGKIIIDDKGIKFEQTTKPFGFVTKEATSNATWVTLTEKDGHTQHEYLKLSGCILWTDRYEECKSILETNFNQSMEIEIEKGHYRNDDYFEVEKFVFSALCILGTDVEPCFESANITRHYSYDEFKKEFQLMLNEYQKSTSIDDDLNNKNKKGEMLMNLEVKENICTLLSSYKYENQFKKADEKYVLLGGDADSATVLDKEDNKLYSLSYAIDENKELIVDFDSKVEKMFTVADKNDNSVIDGKIVVDIFGGLVEEYTKSKVDEKTNEITSVLESTYENKINEISEAYEDLKKSFEVATDKLGVFEKAENERKKEEHKAAIDEVLNKYSVKLGKYSKFLIYRTKINYDEVSVEDVKNDLALMAGHAVMDGADKKLFSYTPEETGIISKIKDYSKSNGRYGNLLDKYKNIK